MSNQIESNFISFFEPESNRIDEILSESKQIVEI